MRSRFVATALCALAMVLMVQVTSKGQTQPAAAPTLTNSSVVKLVRAGFSERAVIAIIRSRPTRFDLLPERLIELKKNRVTEKVILAMIAREQAVEVASENWEDDDSFFNGANGPRTPGGGPSGNSGNSGAAEPGEMDIFGSSGGSRGRTKSRDGSGGVDSDTQTVGSASVRILRPPAEAGGGAAEARLVKTPTLKNDSVVELVEAGFSEGTIIRRIENSPVEFDLSADKLADLRKRRVTESVISAMQAAMNVEK